MITQNKGKDLHKIPKSKLSNGPYYVSIKYDGHYTQIKWDGQEVKFWTSGGKEFYIHNMAEHIKKEYKGRPFHIECEYLYDCEGKLGDRRKSARLTTYRTNHNNSIRTMGDSSKDKFVVLDILDESGTFETRLSKIINMFYLAEWFMVPHQTYSPSIHSTQEYAQLRKAQGFEGAMAKHIEHVYQPGKRTNDIIKLKYRLTADLLCVGTLDGEGKYSGMIGSLELVDSKGDIVNVGSGLDDMHRGFAPEYFIDKVIEIEYEEKRETYMQPVFKRVRDDKTSDEID